MPESPTPDAVAQMRSAAARLEASMASLSADILDLKSQVTADIGTLQERADSNLGLINSNATLIGRVRRNGRWIVGAGALLSLIVGGMAVLFVRAEHNSDEARKASSQASVAQEAFVATCYAGNESRALQRELWGYLFDTVEQKDSPAARKKISEFRQYVNKTFAPRNCNVPPVPAPTVAPTATP